MRITNGATEKQCLIPPRSLNGRRLVRRVAAAAAALDNARYEDFAAGRFRFPSAEGEAR
jgi:hypothetical protein